jgi:hypothetical protein
MLGLGKGLDAWLRRRETGGVSRPLWRADPTRLDVGDIAWAFPPSTVSDAAPWDDYWQAQVTHGVIGFTELFGDDADLVDAMRAGGLRTVLCVGNGLSLEARALAACGFAVTALDLSPWATAMAEQASPPPAHLARLLRGRTADTMGPLRFTAGDLRDPTICPGPFDVIVERRTLQLFPEEERPAALQAVANRLACPGLFISHCHRGSWRQSGPRTHANEAWFTAQGWPRWRPGCPIEGRMVNLLISTG